MRGVEVEEAVRMITTFDVRWACDVLRGAHDASDGVDGRVSIEVDPRFAHDTEKTVAEARQLWWLVNRPNLFIKIPATRAGLPAIAQCLAEGISINVTLIFSLQRYAEVMDAFLEGMERARAAGQDLTRLASVASFFVSRVDTEIDQRLDAVGSVETKGMRGHAAIANARLAHRAADGVFASARWHALAHAGARPQRLLWASAGVKDPAYTDTRYVLDLVADGVVNTMPEATLRAVADHGVVRGDTIRRGYDDAAAVMAALADVGIDYDDVVDKLERDGLTTFQASWAALAQTLQHKLAAATRGSGEKSDPP
jgi:transaldolase